MELSVVIPTHRRPEGLRRVVAAVQAQHRGEVIVVDNETPSTAQQIDGVRLVHERTPGASAARNRGIAEATGDVVVFLDDDVVPENGFIAAIAAALDDPAVDGAGGRVVLDPSVPRPRWLADRGSVGGYLTAFDLGTRRPLGDGEFVVTAAAAFRTAALRDAGGFPVELGPSGGGHLVNDDVVLCRRLQARGARLWFEPDAVVVHDLPAERLRPAWLLRRAWLQGRSDWLSDEALARGRFGGASQALKWLRSELGLRTREGPWRPPVAFHALTDVARTAGALRQAATFAYTSRRRR